MFTCMSASKISMQDPLSEATPRWLDPLGAAGIGSLGMTTIESNPGGRATPGITFLVEYLGVFRRQMRFCFRYFTVSGDSVRFLSEKPILKKNLTAG